MIAFVYNNSIYLNIDRALNELFKNYVVDFANEFESRFIKKIDLLLLKEQSDCKVIKSIYENCKKRLQKDKS